MPLNEMRKPFGTYFSKGKLAEDASNRRRLFILGWSWKTVAKALLCNPVTIKVNLSPYLYPYIFPYKYTI